MFRGLKELAPRIQVRTKVGYVPPGGRSALKRRPSLKLRSEDVRPAIYYKFEQTVELSDGSTINRKSVYPRVEWRMLQDQRNSSTWNPSKPDHKAMLAGKSGKLAKFRRKFGGLGDYGADTEASGASEQDTQSPADDSAFDLDDLISEDAQQITTGRIHQDKKASKKKK